MKLYVLKVMNPVVLAILVVCSPYLTSAAEVTSDVHRRLNKLLDAVQSNNYDRFVADGTPELKAKLTKQMLQGVSTQLSNRLRKGYDTTYLGSLDQQGLKVYLWKLSYKDGGDDTLAKLVLKGNKTAGFWLQ